MFFGSLDSELASASAHSQTPQYATMADPNLEADAVCTGV